MIELPARAPRLARTDRGAPISTHADGSNTLTTRLRARAMSTLLIITYPPVAL
nr:hypothetical protein [Kibdelosporangium sp. MJ126-NF4]